MLVVDSANDPNLVGNLRDAGAQCHESLGLRIGNYAARHDEIHWIALPEYAFHRPQPQFLEARELCEAESESGIVAERAKIAQVVRDALAFQRERAQPRG